jgi:hypothetical protein
MFVLKGAHYMHRRTAKIWKQDYIKGAEQELFASIMLHLLSHAEGLVDAQLRHVSSLPAHDINAHATGSVSGVGGLHTSRQRMSVHVPYSQQLRIATVQMIYGLP